MKLTSIIKGEVVNYHLFSSDVTTCKELLHWTGDNKRNTICCAQFESVNGIWDGNPLK